MAVAVINTGPAYIKIKRGAEAIEDLGYTRNGADITMEAFWLDVPGDENGGDEGPPIEVQYLGEVARVRCELTKYDSVVADKIEARLRDGTAGTPGTPGTLVFSGSKDFRVIILSTTLPRNFPRCIPRMPIELNKGTKFSTLVFEFEAHKDGSGVLYNAVIV